MKVVNRIKKSEEFGLTIKNGTAINVGAFTIHFKNNNLQYTRVGISASTKIGNAVTRSRVKRQLRAMCDSLIKYNSQGLDIVIIIRKQFLKNTFKENENVLSNVFKKQIGIE